MTGRKEPTSFLTLPLELRQKILLYTLTDDALFKNDFEFNHLLSDFSTTIPVKLTIGHHYISATKYQINVLGSDALMAKIFSYVHVDVRISKASPLNIVHVVDDSEKEINHGFIPSHTIALAEKLCSVHPQIKEDITWVVGKALHQVAIALETHVKDYRPKFVSVNIRGSSFESIRRRIRERFEKEMIRDAA